MPDYTRTNMTDEGPCKVCATCYLWTKRGFNFGRCRSGITEKKTNFKITNKWDWCPDWEERING